MLKLEDCNNMQRTNSIRETTLPPCLYFRCICMSSFLLTSNIARYISRYVINSFIDVRGFQFSSCNCKSFRLSWVGPTSRGFNKQCRRKPKWAPPPNYNNWPLNFLPTLFSRHPPEQQPSTISAVFYSYSFHLHGPFTYPFLVWSLPYANLYTLFTTNQALSGPALHRDRAFSPCPPGRGGGWGGVRRLCQWTFRIRQKLKQLIFLIFLIFEIHIVVYMVIIVFLLILKGSCKSSLSAFESC